MPTHVQNLVENCAKEVCAKTTNLGYSVLSLDGRVGLRFSFQSPRGDTLGETEWLTFSEDHLIEEADIKRAIAQPIVSMMMAAAQKALNAR